jgi:hypothetical protein
MFWRSLGKGFRMRAAMLCVVTGAALATTAYSAQVKWVPLNKPPVATPNPSTPSAPVAAEPQTPSPTPEQMTSALLDQMENGGEVDRVKAFDVSKSVNELWFACLARAEQRLRNSKEENVETIGTAVLGSCASEEQLYIRSLRLIFRNYGPVEMNRQVSRADGDAREKAREAITTYLVNYRLSPPQPKK